MVSVMSRARARAGVNVRVRVRVRAKVDPDPFQKAQCNFAPLVRFRNFVGIKFHDT